jgi:hypothetical protein
MDEQKLLEISNFFLSHNLDLSSMTKDDLRVFNIARRM